MKKTAVILCALCFLISLLSHGQEDENAIHCSFEDYPPLRQMQCGLWINNIGDIAFIIKTIRYLFPVAFQA